MAWLTFVTRVSAAIRGLGGLLRKRRQEADLDEELQAYLTMAVEQKMREGMTREQAMREARVQLGGVDAVKEQVRDMWWESLVFACGQDARYAVRTLRKSPGFTIIAMLTLALGIGANTAIFSVVDSLILRALPVAEPRRLVVIGSGPDATQADVFTYPIWEQVRDRASLFDGGLAWSTQRFTLTQGDDLQPVVGPLVNADYFATLGVPALLGRTFTAADDRPGGGPDGAVAVISYGLWQRQFGGAANVIGRVVALDRVPFTIIGVTPPDFLGTEIGSAFDIAVPFGSEPLLRGTSSSLAERRAYWINIMLRLKPTQSLADATAMLRGMQPQIREGARPLNERPETLDGFMKDVLTLIPAATGTSPLRDRFARPLLTILIVVVFVLLIACANIANLLLARAAARQQEVSLRVALGASRWRLARQLLIESLVLATPGALLGLLLAIWGSRALVSQLSNSTFRATLDLSIDWRVLAFTAILAVATAVLFGIAPALNATRVEPIDALKEPRQQTRRASRVSGTLVVAQIALSFVLVIAAGLLVRTFERLASVPLGFDRDRVLVVTIDLTRVQSLPARDPAPRPAFYQRLVDAVIALPGVAQASVSTVTPTSGLSRTFPVEVSGGVQLAQSDRRARSNSVSPGFLATYGTPLIAGRDIDAHDTTGTIPIVLVNKAFVRKFFGIEGDAEMAKALGKTVTPMPPPGSQKAPEPRTIVGIVSDAVYRSPRAGLEPTVYSPMAQDVSRGVTLSVRAASGSPAALAPAIASALAGVDREIAFKFRLLDDQVQGSVAQERLVAILSGFFGGLALLLASLGLYGVTSYAATRRRGEIGIRMALGATHGRVIALVLRRSLVITAIGLGCGLAIAVLVTRYLEVLLFGLTPLDPMTFVLVSMLFAGVASVAAFLPARRATTVDPLVALRHE